MLLFEYSFFFQAEDGIRDLYVTGVQTCALPIWLETGVVMLTTFDLNEYVYEALRIGASGFLLKDTPADRLLDAVRSEEHTSELQSRRDLVCRLLLEKKNKSQPTQGLT